MESGGIFRTIILMGLFLVLVCDYSTLMLEVYQSLHGGNSSQAGPGAGLLEDSALSLDADLDYNNLNLFGGQSRSEVIATIKNACLPKLICELSAGAQSRRLTESETSLLKLISDTSIGTTAEVTSKYHFAAHMGQLISGMDGAGCHSFYTTCPLPGLQVLQMMKKVRMR